MRKIILIQLIVLISFQAYSSDRLWELISAGNYEDAVEEALSHRNEEDIYNLYLATLYNILGDLDRSVIYQFEYDKNPQNTVDFAIQNAKDTTSRFNDGNILTFFGIQLWEERQNDLALHFLEAALEKTPDNPYANNYYSMKFYYSKQGDEYLKYSMKAIELKPDYSEAYNNAAVAYMYLDDYTKAAETLVDCISNCENPHKNTYYNLMSSLKESDGISIKNRHGGFTIEGSLSFTEEGCNGLYSIVKDYPRKCELLLLELLTQGNYSAFQYIYEKAIDDEIEIATAFLNYISSYFYDDIPKACEYGIEYLNQAEVRIEYIYDIGNFFSRYSPENAPQFYLKAIEMRPDYDSLAGMRYYANLGTSYLRNGDLKTGVGYLEKALDFNLWDTITLVNLGMAYSDLGETEKAKGYLLRAKDTTSNTDYLKKINDLLSGL